MEQTLEQIAGRGAEAILGGEGERRAEDAIVPGKGKGKGKG